MHAAGHHREPGAFRQQLNRRRLSKTEAKHQHEASQPAQVHCCTRCTDNWLRDEGCQQHPPLELLLEKNDLLLSYSLVNVMCVTEPYMKKGGSVCVTDLTN